MIQTALLMPSFFGAGAAKTPSADIVADDIPLPSVEPGAVLHVHRPRSGRHPAFVVTLGLHPADPNDPRVKALLDGLAARGYAAGLVESPGLDNDVLLPSARDDIVAAFMTMAAAPYVEPNRTAILGFSVGGSLALLAAEDPEIAPRVRLVEALGAYARLESVARATLTGMYVTEDGSQTWSADLLTRSAVPENLILLLASPSDRPALLSWLSAGMPAGQAPAISPDGQVVERLLTAVTGQQFDTALASLPSDRLATLQSLSPLASVSTLDAPVYLMVDRHDPLVPPNESILLAQDFQAHGRAVYLSRFDIFRHVEPTHLQPSIGLLRDVLRLFWHTHVLLLRMRSND